jgi:hypothetical protein
MPVERVMVYIYLVSCRTYDYDVCSHPSDVHQKKRGFLFKGLFIIYIYLFTRAWVWLATGSRGKGASTYTLVGN